MPLLPYRFSRSAPRRTRILATGVVAVLACTAVTGAWADEPAATELAAICTDRPTKSNYACVVEPGHFQVEADGVSYTHLRIDGVTTDTYLVTNPTVKVGVAPGIDLEANISPYEIVRSRDDQGFSRTLRGPGDLFVRGKWNFYAGDKLTATVLPYVKAPTARHGIGNGALESGILFPINYALTDKITLTTVPEFDSLKDADNRGHHFNTAQLVNVGIALPHDLTAYGELWGNWNVDPAGTVRQYSADVALAWGVTKYFQLDAGLNFGLNRSTPSVQAYVGVSRKF